MLQRQRPLQQRHGLEVHLVLVVGGARERGSMENMEVENTSGGKLRYKRARKMRELEKYQKMELFSVERGGEHVNYGQLDIESTLFQDQKHIAKKNST